MNISNGITHYKLEYTLKGKTKHIIQLLFKKHTS